MLLMSTTEKVIGLWKSDCGILTYIVSEFLHSVVLPNLCPPASLCLEMFLLKKDGYMALCPVEFISHSLNFADSFPMILWYH